MGFEDVPKAEDPKEKMKRLQAQLAESMKKPKEAVATDQQAESAEAVKPEEAPAEALEAPEEAQSVEKAEILEEKAPEAEAKAEAPEEKEISEGDKENARKVAEEKLAGLESKILKKWKETHELGKKQNMPPESFGIELLKSDALIVLTAGVSFGIGKLLERRRNKKIEKQLEKIKLEREDLRDELGIEKLKSKDPEKYEWRVMSRKIRKKEASLQDVADYNNKMKNPDFKIDSMLKNIYKPL